MTLLRRAARAAWALHGRVASPPVPRPSGPHATVVMALYHPVRLRHLDAHVRNILRSPAVDRLILSNHDPDNGFRRYLRVSDPRVTVVEHPVRQGGAVRWDVARAADAEQVLVVDDDVMLWPWQLTRLCDALREDPSVPHGLCGFRDDGPARFDYVQRAETRVDLLTEVYAVTRSHLRRYAELAERFAGPEAPVHLGGHFDFALISRSGEGRPRIHDVGRILRCDSCDADGVAVHRRARFWQTLSQVLSVLDAPPGQVDPPPRRESAPVS